MRVRYSRIPVINEDGVLLIGTPSDYIFIEYSFVVDFISEDLPSGDKYFKIMQANIPCSDFLIDIKTPALDEFVIDLIRKNFELIDLNFEKEIL